MRNRIPFTVLFLLSLVLSACRDQPRTPPKPAPEAGSVRKEASLRDPERVLVLPGLTADRVERKVTVDAKSTGLEGGGIVEFAVIAENSAHDYEALLIALAKPSDISAAIEFIGVPRGRAVRASELSFWPKGERVVVSVLREGEAPKRIEEMILDVRRPGSPPLPLTGFIHAGSLLVERNGEPFFAADGEGPGSIASSYNEPTTVLDLPHQAQQGEVYERFVANPEALLPKGERVTIEIVPEPRPPEHPLRVVDLTLVVSMPEGVQEIARATLRLVEAGQSPDTAPELPMAEALRACRDYLPDRDPYVTLDWSDSTPLRAAAEIARVLQSLDNASGLRLEAPKSGQLYYKAFLPQNAWRERAERPTQPCELRFSRDGEGGTTVSLVRIEEIWSENPNHWRPDLKIHEQEIAGPEALPEALTSTGVTLPVLLVFAPGDLTLGAILPYVRAVQETHPNLHVFVED